jgi:hypothetical protein
MGRERVQVDGAERLLLAIAASVVIGYRRLEYEGLQMLTLATPRRPSVVLAAIILNGAWRHRSDSENLVPSKREKPVQDKYLL